MKSLPAALPILMFIALLRPCPAQTNSTNAPPAAVVPRENWQSVSNRWSRIALPQIKKSAENGDVSAQYYLGVAFSEGYGVDQQPDEAYKWLKLAADQGLAGAQYKLGRMLYKGLGVEKDMPAGVEWFRKAAEQGDAQAESFLGYTYATMDPDKPDYELAEKWMRRAADQGSADAQYNYGHLLTHEFNQAGQWVPNFPKAAEWLTKAAEQGQAKAQCELAEMYDTGKLGDDERSNCIPWFLKAAANGNADAQAELGSLRTVYPDSPLLKSANTVEALRQSAESGNLEAQYDLANRYRIGDGVPKDPGEAFKWMQKAAGHDLSQSTQATEASYELAVMYEQGEGVARDLTRAYELYQSSVEGGFLSKPDPEYRLAQMYEKGQGVPQNDLTAANYYFAATQFGPVYYDIVSVVTTNGSDDSTSRMDSVTNYCGTYAAESLFNLYVQGRGLPEEKSEALDQFKRLKDTMKTARWQFLVGEVYYHGKLDKQDLGQAAAWFDKAAAQGSPDAMNRIGEMWAAGNNGAPDAKEAARWYRKAALMGFAAAQLNFARACLKGDGVEQDLIEAGAWLQLAADQNLEPASRELTLLETKLSPEQRQQAIRRAQELASGIPLKPLHQ